MKRYSKLAITIAVLLLVVLTLTSATLAQDADPPIEISDSFNSGTLAVVVLIIMLVERLLSKILPYITKSNKEKNDPAVDAIKMLCDELKSVKITTGDTNAHVKDTNVRVRELHEWHNVPDPLSGRMVWSGVGLVKLQETMHAISENIRVNTEAMKKLLEEKDKK